MARVNSLIKIEGTLDQLTFYKSQDGHLVKTKGGVAKSRIMNDPNFIRTRENGQEFGLAATSGKFLRDSLRTMIMTASDNRVTSRLTQLMMEIKNFDTTSARGSRNVGVGIIDPSAGIVLQGFEFNRRAILGSVLLKPYTVNTTTGVVSIPGLVPVNDINIIQGATHVTFSSCFAIVDFANGVSDVQYSNKVNIIIDPSLTNVVLTPTALPSGTGTKLILLRIEYFQEVNGVQYSLKNGAFNALSIISVS
jgi:hypothetical protein